MKNTLFLLIFLLIPALLPAQTFDTCTVTGYVFNSGGAAEDSLEVQVIKTVGYGTRRPMVSTLKRTFYTNSAGLVTMTLLRNSVVTVNADAYGFSGDVYLVIPNTTTARLEAVI